MFEDEFNRDNFEEMVRSIAREVSRSMERASEFDLDEIAGAIGVDPVRAREWVDGAVGWLREQAEGVGHDVSPWGPGPADAPSDDPAPNSGPHPLDLPTPEQGRALAALDSARWTVEPGSHVLKVHGDGPEPGDPLGLVGELRARDWIAADGQVTLVGRRALSRWLDVDPE